MREFFTLKGRGIDALVLICTLESMVEYDNDRHSPNMVDYDIHWHSALKVDYYTETE